MKIQLKNWKIANLSMSLLDERTKRDNDSFDLESGNFFSDNKDDNTQANNYYIQEDLEKINIEFSDIYST